MTEDMSGFTITRAEELDSLRAEVAERKVAQLLERDAITISEVSALRAQVAALRADKAELTAVLKNTHSALIYCQEYLPVHATLAKKVDATEKHARALLAKQEAK